MTDNTSPTPYPSEPIGELSDTDPVERAVFIALDEAAAKLDAQGDFEPSLTIVQGEDLHIEELNGDDEASIIAQARQTVMQMSNAADAYILAYDGFVDLDDGPSDAIIVEFARPAEAEATVLGWLYEEHNGHYHYSEELYSLGSADNLFLSGDETEPTDIEDDMAVEPSIEISLEFDDDATDGD
jgi:hypothetical protein